MTIIQDVISNIHGSSANFLCMQSLLVNLWLHYINRIKTFLSLSLPLSAFDMKSLSLSLNILEYSRYSKRETFNIKNWGHTDKHTHRQTHKSMYCVAAQLKMYWPSGMFVARENKQKLRPIFSEVTSLFNPFCTCLSAYVCVTLVTNF